MKLTQILKESVTINGATEAGAKYYSNVGQHLIRELNIPKGKNIIVHLNHKDLDGDEHNGSTLPDITDNTKIHIYLKPGLDRATLLRALCHEFVHAEQMASGRLVLDIKDKKLQSMKWEGTEIENPSYNRSSEWELEAHIKEKELLHRVIKAVGNFEVNENEANDIRDIIFGKELK